MSTEARDTMHPSYSGKIREPLALKLLKSFSVAIVIALAVSTPLFLYFQNKALRNDLIREGQTLANLLAYHATAGVFAEKKELLQDAVRGVVSQKSVKAVAVYAWNGKLLHSDPVEERGDEAIRSDGKGTLPKPEEGRMFEVIDSRGQIEILAPVVLETPVNPWETMYFDNPSPESNKSVIGYVRLTMNTDLIGHQTKAMVIRNVLSAVILLLAGLFVASRVIRRITRPLTNLTEAVRSFGVKGEISDLPVGSEDEIGNLARAFNTMQKDLKAREEENRQLEEQLRYSQKMEAVGTLARGVAHDFSNILSTVQGTMFLLEKKLDPDSPLRKYVEQTHTPLNKAKSLMQGLITFSRLKHSNPVELDLNLLIRRLRPMLASIAGETVAVELAVPERPYQVMGDMMQMEQVLMNLCSNARDAMPDGGTFKVTTSETSLPGGMTPGPEMTAGRYVLIETSDTGTGMDEQTRQRIFEPFFTTKDVGKGTGLGLAIVFGVVTEMKGHIEAHSTRGEGTVFRIFLPLLEKRGEY